jgi:DNA gyrase/topoisomerase IV subunit B
MAKTTYDASNITYFESDLHKVRAKPQMYIGPTDSTGVFTILREAMDNAVDEYQAGNNKTVDVFLGGDELWVVDTGRGIPVEKHPVAKKSTLTVALTSLQSSGKMDATGGGAYATSIGTHGVGLKATNALSRAFDVWTCRKNEWWHTRFEQGNEKKPVTKAKAPKLPNGKLPKVGTIIRFAPDPKIFGKHKLIPKDVIHWAEMTAYMNPGLTISATLKGKTKTWHSKKGITELIDKRVVESKANVVGKMFVHNSKQMDLAIAFTDAEGVAMQAYTNTVYNLEGGTHLTAFYDALFRSLKDYKTSKCDFTPTDLREGIIGVLNYKIASPRFDSQTKEKLVDERVGKPCLEECEKMLKAFWDKNKSMAKNLTQRAADLRKATFDFQQNKKLMRQLKPNKSKMLLPGKLTASPKCKPEKRELFLVEGDSAGGTAKLARNKDYQEVFYLRGKILNAMRSKDAQVLASEEVIGILQAIGFDPSQKDPMSKLRVGRIVWLSDPDDDGYHINTLGLTLLYKYLPRLFELGKVFIVAASEYTAKINGKRIFANSLDGLAKLNAGKVPNTALHIKGWGEVNADALREMAFDPKTRRMYRVEPPTDNGKTFKLIMSDDPTYRKKMLGV